MNTKAYRELIREVIRGATQHTKNAHFHIAESPADTITLWKTADALRNALTLTEEAMGMIKAHRALTDKEEN